MTPERWQLIKGILGEALEQSGDQRDAYIENACGKDEQLRSQIESLLHHDGEAESEYFLKQRTLLYESSQSGPVKVCETQVPDEIGGHQLLEEIGRGGMGVVYKARNIKLNRTVALKMILTGQLATTEDIDRFRTEAQAAAKLDHPNIVPVHEVGEESGHHFFSMGLVEGESLADRLDQGPMPERDAAELIKVIAKAVDYAHHQGILHRDLKPSNILLSHDNTPKVTDFGLAKLLDDESTKTHTGAMGTPSYMSPEQVSGKTKKLGPATDVYALGAILYEAVTGRPPFQAATVLETLAQVCSGEPVSPRKLQPKLSRDVDTICLKCLQKEPIARYESADALSDDLQRFIDGEPIRARRAGYITRARRWCRRHPVAIAVAVTLLVAVTGILGILVHNETRRRERETERLGERRAERRADYISDIQLAEREWEAGRFGEVLACLNRYDTPEAGEEDLRGWEWYYQWRLCQQEIHRFDAKVGAVYDISMHPDRKRLAGAYRDGKVRIWEIVSGKLNATISFEASPEKSAGDSTQIYPTTVAFSPDGRWIAAGAIGGRVNLFSVEKASERRILASPAQEQVLLTDTVWEVAFSRDGSWLAACDNAGTIVIWDARNWHLVSRIALPFDNEASRPISDIEFSTDGSYLAAACADGKLRVWEINKAGTEVTPRARLAQDFSNEGLRIHSLAFHPDGDKILIGGRDSFVRIVDIRSGKEIGLFQHGQEQVRCVAFSHNGDRIAVAAADATVKVWNCSDLGKPKAIRHIRGHTSQILAAEFNPDDQFLVSASVDGMIKAWDAHGGVDSLHIAGGHHWNPLERVHFMPDGQGIVSVDRIGQVCVWDMTSLHLIHDTRLGEIDARLGEIVSATVNSDGLLATASTDNVIRLWEVDAESQVGKLIGHEKGVTDVAFSHDGRTIASAGLDKTVIVWDTYSQHKKRVLSGHASAIYAIAFSPDDSRLVSVDDGGSIRLWSVADGQLLRTFNGADSGLRDVRFSPSLL